eukprot:TRINITY_DN93039_c0_g1_i1.p1 TRINITY_DN93039_c0_g1~~TRINITY_DN93039_c0_g1_i1.p1  ORF type:complete len:735 (-),score=167.84 TRINITY_DN93039_c0_g1_i1:151-2289(-)
MVASQHHGYGPQDALTRQASDGVFSQSSLPTESAKTAPALGLRGTHFQVGSRARKGGTSIASDTSRQNFRQQERGAFVHGTKMKHFESILKQGLKAGISKIFMVDEIDKEGRIPGLNDPPEILIFIDEQKARSQGMGFDYDEDEDTWFTTGIDSVIRPWFFQKVIDNRALTRGAILFQSKDDPMMTRRVQKKPRYLLHATYWQNLAGVMKEGVIPGKKPVGQRRREFGSLLHDAEDVVHCVEPSLARRETDAMRVDSRSASKEAPERRRLDPVQDVDEVEYTLDIVGLDERAPDALVTIDVDKILELGGELVQSEEREDQFFVMGAVPPEAIVSVEQNVPRALPEHLLAKIVDPRSFQDIPIIDMSQDEAKLVEQLRYACTEVGFMQITNTEVSLELQQRLVKHQKAFFELPESKKATLRVGPESPVRGYFGKGEENCDNLLLLKGDAEKKKTVTDNKEGLDFMGVPESKHPDDSFIGWMFGHPDRLLPEEDMPGFAETLKEYRAAVFGLAKRILGYMALIVGKPKDFFEEHVTNPIATQRLLHYWPLKDFDTEIGIGEHTDYGLMTILMQDMVGGLQVLNAKDMSWVHVPPLEGAFVLNVGDMMARWTGNYFKSTVHRVVNVAPVHRYSAPFFLETNLESVIKPGGLYQGPLVNDIKALTCEETVDMYYTKSGMIKDEYRQAFALRQREAQDAKKEKSPSVAKGGGYPLPA